MPNTNRRNLIKSAAAVLTGAPLAAATHIASLAEGQPTLVGMTYSEEESAMLRRVLDDYRREGVPNPLPYRFSSLICES